MVFGSAFLLFGMACCILLYSRYPRIPYLEKMFTSRTRGYTAMMGDEEEYNSESDALLLNERN
jgi:hypothetical protein